MAESEALKELFGIEPSERLLKSTRVSDNIKHVTNTGELQDYEKDILILATGLLIKGLSIVDLSENVVML
jgi:hypothetical protein